MSELIIRANNESCFRELACYLWRQSSDAAVHGFMRFKDFSNETKKPLNALLKKGVRQCTPDI